jgi:hypothetical protein
MLMLPTALSFTLGLGSLLSVAAGLCSFTGSFAFLRTVGPGLLFVLLLGISGSFFACGLGSLTEISEIH